MHPAPSVIIFTTLSGLGFGLLFFLGLGIPDVSGMIALTFFVIAFALACGGLLASAFHLGRPERAWRAFSQWKTSWLSREGLCAVAALLVMGLYAIGAIFMDAEWRYRQCAEHAHRVHHVDDLYPVEDHSTLAHQTDPRAVLVSVAGGWCAAGGSGQDGHSPIADFCAGSDRLLETG